MSAETLHFHHDKHHAAYVAKTVTLARAAGLDGEPLEEIVRRAGQSGDRALFNNAAQAWNHAFFWESMTPSADRAGGRIARAMDASFGGVEKLKQAFVHEGMGHFGSGWVWLAANLHGDLHVCSTHDAETLADNRDLVPLLVCDVWEHAYYLDRKNDRKAYLEAWFDKLANWAFASDQLEAAEAGKRGWCFPVEETETA